MTVPATIGSLVAAVDVDQVTDLIGIPLAALLIALLVLIDLGDVPRDGGARVPALLARRRPLVAASAVAAVALVGVLVTRIIGMAG